MSDAASETPPSSPPGEPDLLPVDARAVCAKCGYSLTGLSRQGVCPECGAAIRDSLERGPMAFLTRSDAILLRTGAQLVAWSMWLLVANVLILIPISAGRNEGALWCGIPLLAAGCLLWTAGWVVLAGVKARGEGMGAGFVKALGFLLAAVQALWVVVGLLLALARMSWDNALAALLGFGVCAVLMGVLGTFRLASLARRAAGEDLPKGAVDVTSIVFITIVINIVALVVGVVGNSGVGLVLFFMGLPIDLALLVGVHGLLWALVGAARLRVASEGAT